MERPDATPYPGDLIRLDDLLRLAEAYRRAAQAVAGLGRRGDPVSRAPYRLNAIQAIELYLNALLLHLGRTPGEIRGLQHDLGARAELACAHGLALRLRTQQHLRTLAVSREYLISRYALHAKVELSPVNRLAATLEEVADKVTARLAGDGAAGPILPPSTLPAAQTA